MGVLADVTSTQKFFFAEVIIRQGIKALAAKFSLSFLVGPLNFLFVWVGTKALSFLFEETALGASVIYRKFKSEKDRKNYLKAVDETYKNMDKKKSLTWEQRVELEEALVAATRKFIRVHGLRTQG